MEAMTVRPVSTEDIPALTRVHVDAWRETYTGIVPQSFLDSLTYENREARWQRILAEPRPDDINFVAEVDGQVVGFSSGGRERQYDGEFTGELYALYLLKSAQGRGLGRRLFEAVVEHLVSKSYSNMLIWVLRDNPTVKFYQHLGGVEVREKEVEIGGKKLLEYAYGWPDLGAVR